MPSKIRIQYSSDFHNKLIISNNFLYTQPSKSNKTKKSSSIIAQWKIYFLMNL
uniref:Uncharacterized protein n=1 Tax=Rhizophora mucronata TaxID=61149 RepID=A0A2P2Q7I6_RHIMU